MAFCQQCGKELAEGAKFCIECGTAVERKSAADMEEKQANEAAEVINELSAEAASGQRQSTSNTSAPQNGGANSQNQYQYQQQTYDPRKSRTLAGILGILFGCFGVHNFYLGYTSKAVIQLCVSIVGLLLSCFVIGAFIVMGIAIWGLVEGIMILAGSINVDGKGIPLKD